MEDWEENSRDSVCTRMPRQNVINLIILLVINLLNYMDRFTIASVLLQIQQYFNIGDSEAGFLQTVFIVLFLIFAPLFGYLGDRFNRKLIMMVGLLIWIAAVFACTFVDANHFWLFVLCRGIVGIGEASYSTIAPTVIADLFVNRQRSICLMLFYFAIPIGSGFGFIVGSNLSAVTGSWQLGVRLTPILGIICLICLTLFLVEPVRGSADHARPQKTSFCADISYLITVRTYIFSTLGLTCVVSVAGCLSWWAPTLIEYAWILDSQQKRMEIKSSISMTFGVIACLAGVAGVFLGSVLSQVWQKGMYCMKPNKCADSYICAIGAFLGVPCLFLALISAAHHIAICWVFVFLGVLFCSFNWSVNADILLYTMVPDRRAVANAMQTSISHLFGDASMPFLVGLFSDFLRGQDTSATGHFYSLKYALFFPNVILIGGGAMYLLSSFYLLSDKQKALLAMHGDAGSSTADNERSPLIHDSIDEQSN